VIRHLCYDLVHWLADHALQVISGRYDVPKSGKLIGHGIHSTVSSPNHNQLSTNWHAPIVMNSGWGLVAFWAKDIKSRCVRARGSRSQTPENGHQKPVTLKG
jgi:hypothetical protein